MLEHAEPVLKWVCVGLAALLLVKGAGTVRRLNPLTRTSVPEPPTWTPPSPAPSAAGAPVVPTPGPPRSPGGSPGSASAVTFDPDIEARLERVTQSELLGPVMRPPPMALLGIAGPEVFFRAPGGQSGLVREGGELGGVQIVRVGTNRVLVRQDGELKELMIFQGIGGESLLPKGKEGSP